MTLHAYNSDVLFTTTLDLGSSDDFIVGSNGFVYGQGTLVQGRSGNSFTLAGGVSAAEYVAFQIGSASDQASHCQFLITSTGVVQAGIGILYSGGGLSVVNRGTIACTISAITMFNPTGGRSIIDNAGTIVGGGSATILALACTIRNSGSIINTGDGYSLLFQDVEITDDRVINSGFLGGSVRLGGGNDLYDGRGGGTVDGAVFGDTGDDRFRPGAAEELFDGGDGSDLLDFRGGVSAVEIALNGAWEQSGWAENDTYAGFENVTGTRLADRIGGDSAANQLAGLAGDDTMQGLAGADLLTGGNGIDRLAGGAGNDSFQFNLLSDCGDLISDFSSAAAGNNDRMLISAAGFGGGLVAGALAASQFRARADNLAQDGDDRFIFRTSDRTLWFDADGNGAGAAVLVADLQAGASMTAADIVIL